MLLIVKRTTDSRLQEIIDGIYEKSFCEATECGRRKSGDKDREPRLPRNVAEKGLEK